MICNRSRTYVRRLARGRQGWAFHHLASGHWSIGREPHERLIGSIAFAAVARVVMIATKTLRHARARGTLKRRVLIRAKSNIGPDGSCGYVYNLDEQIELSEIFHYFASRDFVGRSCRWHRPRGSS